MKQEIYTQYEGVQTQDLNTLIEEMNRYMRMHADGQPQGTWKVVGDSFIGVVEYTIDMRIPETELERFEEAHGIHRCYECPLLEIDKDKRRKCYPCTLGGQSRTDAPCCEWFYKQLEAGKIKVGD